MTDTATEVRVYDISKPARIITAGYTEEEKAEYAEAMARTWAYLASHKTEWAITKNLTIGVHPSKKKWKKPEYVPVLDEAVREMDTPEWVYKGITFDISATITEAAGRRLTAKMFEKEYGAVVRAAARERCDRLGVTYERLLRMVDEKVPKASALMREPEAPPSLPELRKKLKSAIRSRDNAIQKIKDLEAAIAVAEEHSEPEIDEVPTAPEPDGYAQPIEAPAAASGATQLSGKALKRAERRARRKAKKNKAKARR